LVSGLRPWSWVAAGGNGANGRIPIDESYHQKSKDEGKHGEAAQDNLSGLPIFSPFAGDYARPTRGGRHSGSGKAKRQNRCSIDQLTAQRQAVRGEPFSFVLKL
jgi:hypothetical protein